MNILSIDEGLLNASYFTNYTPKCKKSFSYFSNDLFQWTRDDFITEILGMPFLLTINTSYIDGQVHINVSTTQQYADDICWLLQSTKLLIVAEEFDDPNDTESYYYLDLTYDIRINSLNSVGELSSIMIRFLTDLSIIIYDSYLYGCYL